MKKLPTIALLLCLGFAIPSYAQYAPPASTPATTKQAEPDESKLQTHSHYTNKAGQSVHSPAKATDGKAPSGASATCGDGSYSFSKSRRGTCSHHGGVSVWL